MWSFKIKIKKIYLLRENFSILFFHKKTFSALPQPHNSSSISLSGRKYIYAITINFLEYNSNYDAM